MPQRRVMVLGNPERDLLIAEALVAAYPWLRQPGGSAYLPEHSKLLKPQEYLRRSDNPPTKPTKKEVLNARAAIEELRKLPLAELQKRKSTSKRLVSNDARDRAEYGALNKLLIILVRSVGGLSGDIQLKDAVKAVGLSLKGDLWVTRVTITKRYNAAVEYLSAGSGGQIPDRYVGVTRSKLSKLALALQRPEGMGASKPTRSVEELLALAAKAQIDLSAEELAQALDAANKYYLSSS